MMSCVQQENISDYSETILDNDSLSFRFRSYPS